LVLSKTKESRIVSRNVGVNGFTGKSWTSFQGKRVIRDTPKVLGCLGIQEGDVVLIRLQDSEVRVVPLRQALVRARELTAQYISRDRSLAEELIGERRKDAERE
jgi:hypothetical protein